MIWLKFYIAKGILVGRIGTEFVTMSAVSGGGGGKDWTALSNKTKVMSRWDWNIVNSTPAINTRIAYPAKPGLGGGQRLGPVPPGPYHLINPFREEHRLNGHQLQTLHIRLEKDPSRLSMKPPNDPQWGRSHGYRVATDLEIHNTGRLGSDGCIVPLYGDFMRLAELMEASAGTQRYLGILDVYKDF